MKSFILYLLSFLIAGALGFGGVYAGKQLFGGKEVTPVVKSLSDLEKVSLLTQDNSAAEDYTKEEDSYVDKAEDVAAEEPVREIEPAPAAEAVFEIASAGKPVAVSEGMFKLSGIRVNGGSGDYKYVLSDKEGHKYESYNGTFGAVAANTNGYYGLKAVDMVTGKETNAKTVSGFKYIKPVEKLSAAEIAEIINSGSSDRLKPVSDRISKNVKVSSNEPDVKTLNSALMRVNMDNMRASVSNVQYDATGHVTSLTITLQ
ncbi:MAG: hypothetical protein IKZ91_03890 [Bacteroidales bacterium]|nr:hypothetical protein [Bacteroidales bacterium]